MRNLLTNSLPYTPFPTNFFLIDHCNTKLNIYIFFKVLLGIASFLAYSILFLSVVVARKKKNKMYIHVFNYEGFFQDFLLAHSRQADVRAAQRLSGSLVFL